MANPFDQFDEAKPPGNPFDQFDKADEPQTVEPQPQQREAAQKESGVIDKVNDAFLSLPGGDVLAELAAASNRTMFDMMDFFGPDNVNAVLELAGSDKRVPTFGGSMASEGEYMEEGLPRDIVQNVGEVVPMAATGGAALRGASSRLPAMAPGEGAATGTLRQLGAGTARQDVAGGAAAGVGGAVGREYGGAPGEAIGSTVGALTTSIPSMAKGVARTADKRIADKLFAKASPTSRQLREEAGKIYKTLDDMGVTVKQPEMQQLTDDIQQTIKRSGFNARIHPKVAATLDEIAEKGQAAQPLSELDILRRVAGSAARSLEPDEQRLANIIIQKIDDFVDDVPATAMQGADSGTVGPLYRQARGLWSRARKSELISEALEKADLQASGLENGIRVQFRSLLNNKKKMKGFTPEEKSAMREVVEGTTASNVFKALGRLGVSEGQATNMLTGSLGMAGGGALGASVGGPMGAAAGAGGMLAIGQGARKAAQSITKNNAKLADAIVRAKDNGREIALAYMRSTPAKQRNVRELTGLLLQPGVKLKPLERMKESTISQAAFAAGLIRAAEEANKPEEAEDDTNTNQ